MWNLNDLCGILFEPSVIYDYKAKTHQYSSSTSETSALVTKANLSYPNPALCRIIRDHEGVGQADSADDRATYVDSCTK